MSPLFDLLEVYLRQVGPDLKLWFKNDSGLDSMRSHPRYAKLLELAGYRTGVLRASHQVSGLPGPMPVEC